MTAQRVAVPGENARPAPERRWMPVLVVVALIGLVVGGGRSLSALVAPDPEAALQVGAAVQLQPRAGWDVQTVAATPSARLHRGPVVLEVLAMGPDPSGPAAVAARYVAEHLRVRLSQLVFATPDPTTLANGVPAVRLGYVGVTADGRPVEGVVVAATSVQASAVFDAWAPSGELATVADDLHAMVDGAVIS